MVGFCVAQLATIPLLRRTRIELVDIAEEMLADDSLSEASRLEINNLLDTAMSFRVGILIPVAQILFCIHMVMRVPDEPDDQVSAHPKFNDLMLRYVLSNAGNNLPAGIVTLLLMPLVWMVGIACGDDDSWGEFEDSVFRLADRVGSTAGTT